MSQTPPSRRRFIAGAVCPRCRAMDKIVVDLDRDIRECVSCGYTDERPEAPSAAGELPTRVRSLTRRHRCSLSSRRAAVN